jgi:hypothetical protein
MRQVTLDVGCTAYRGSVRVEVETTGWDVDCGATAAQAIVFDRGNRCRGSGAQHHLTPAYPSIR